MVTVSVIDGVIKIKATAAVSDAAIRDLFESLYPGQSVEVLTDIKQGDGTKVVEARLLR